MNIKSNNGLMIKNHKKIEISHLRLNSIKNHKKNRDITSMTKFI